MGEFEAFWARFAGALRVGVGRRVCATRGARARLEGGGGAKKGRARVLPRKPIRRAGAVAELARARVGALRARVMLMRGRARLSFWGAKLKKGLFFEKKYKKRPPNI